MSESLVLERAQSVEAALGSLAKHTGSFRAARLFEETLGGAEFAAKTFWKLYNMNLLIYCSFFFARVFGLQGFRRVVLSFFFRLDGGVFGFEPSHYLSVASENQIWGRVLSDFDSCSFVLTRSECLGQSKWLNNSPNKNRSPSWNQVGPFFKQLDFVLWTPFEAYKLLHGDRALLPTERLGDLRRTRATAPCWAAKQKWSMS